jgi:hypothetical protein
MDNATKYPFMKEPAIDVLTMSILFLSMVGRGVGGATWSGNHGIEVVAARPLLSNLSHCHVHGFQP